MTKLSGTIEVQGRDIKWQRNPATGGWTLFFGIVESIHLEQEPTQETAAVALDAYEQGKTRGQEIGRAVLQNDFRNLMACQPR